MDGGVYPEVGINKVNLSMLLHKNNKKIKIAFLILLIFGQKQNRKK